MIDFDSAICGEFATKLFQGFSGHEIEMIDIKYQHLDQGKAYLKIGANFNTVVSWFAKQKSIRMKVFRVKICFPFLLCSRGNSQL